MVKIFYDWYITIFEGLYSSEGMYSTFSKYNDLFSTLLGNDIFKNIVAAIISAGMGICLIYFLLDMSDKATAQNFTFEYIMRSFLKLCIAFFLMTHCMDIIKLMVDIGTGLAANIQTENVGSDFFQNPDNVEAFKNGLTFISLKDGIGYAIKGLIPYVVIFLCNIITIFIAISRVVELTIRAVFAPIGVSDCFVEESRSNGIRYLKKIAALALQFALMVMITVCIGLLMSAVVGEDSIAAMTDAFEAGFSMGNAFHGGPYFKKDQCIEFLDALFASEHYWTCLALAFTKIGLLIKSISVSNDIIGV